MIAYADTSAIIRFVLRTEKGHETALVLWDRADAVVTNRIAYPEARAALADARRQNRIGVHEYSTAKSYLEARWRDLDVIELRARLSRAAGNVAERFGLRGYDAVHLASALSIPRQLVVLTWDGTLADAARSAGLRAAPR